MAIQTGQPIIPSDFVGNPAPYLSIENTVGVTHSLTTVANQQVHVIVKGHFTGTTGQETVSLKYNGVIVDSVEVRHQSSGTGYLPFCLQWVNVPGADTQNLTVETTGGSIGGVSIVVTKLLIG